MPRNMSLHVTPAHNYHNDNHSDVRAQHGMAMRMTKLMKLINLLLKMACCPLHNQLAVSSMKTPQLSSSLILLGLTVIS